MAHAKGLMLSLFHNRRWDGDYLTIRSLIEKGLIGEVFHIECGQAGYGHPGFWWRSDKAISGGVMHDWGAHFIDWILNLVPAKITRICCATGMGTYWSCFRISTMRSPRVS